MQTLKFALLDECIKREKLLSKAQTTYLKIIAVMAALREDGVKEFQYVGKYAMGCVSQTFTSPQFIATPLAIQP